MPHYININVLNKRDDKAGFSGLIRRRQEPPHPSLPNKLAPIKTHLNNRRVIRHRVLQDGRRHQTQDKNLGHLGTG